MKTTQSKHLAAGCAAALTFATLSANAQNLLVDPGFETQTGWSLFNGAAYSTNFAHTGSWSMYDSAVNNVPGSFESFPANAGSAYDLTGFGLRAVALNGSPAFGVVQITYFSGPNATGSNLGTVETSPGNALASAQVNASSTLDTWIPLDTGPATAPAGTQSIAAYTIYVDFSGNSGQGVYFDDLNLTYVPEPTSLALLGVGAIALPLWLRRRTRA